MTIGPISSPTNMTLSLAAANNTVPVRPSGEMSQDSAGRQHPDEEFVSALSAASGTKGPPDATVSERTNEGEPLRKAGRKEEDSDRRLVLIGHTWHPTLTGMPPNDAAGALALPAALLAHGTLAISHGPAGDIDTDSPPVAVVGLGVITEAAGTGALPSGLVPGAVGPHLNPAMLAAASRSGDTQGVTAPGLSAAGADAPAAGAPYPGGPFGSGQYANAQYIAGAQYAAAQNAAAQNAAAQNEAAQNEAAQNAVALPASGARGLTVVPAAGAAPAITAALDANAAAAAVAEANVAAALGRHTPAGPQGRPNLTLIGDTGVPTARPAAGPVAAWPPGAGPTTAGPTTAGATTAGATTPTGAAPTPTASIRQRSTGRGAATPAPGGQPVSLGTVQAPPAGGPASAPLDTGQFRLGQAGSTSTSGTAVAAGPGQPTGAAGQAVPDQGLPTLSVPPQSAPEPGTPELGTPELGTPELGTPGAGVPGQEPAGRDSADQSVTPAAGATPAVAPPAGAPIPPAGLLPPVGQEPLARIGQLSSRPATAAGTVAATDQPEETGRDINRTDTAVDPDTAAPATPVPDPSLLMTHGLATPDLSATTGVDLSRLSDPDQPPVPTPATQVADQIVPLRADGDGVHRIAMELRPDNLGTIGVVAEIRNGQIHLHFTGANELTRETLRAALPDLRQQLENAGFADAAFDFNDHEPANQNAARQFGADQGAGDQPGRGGNQVTASSPANHGRTAAQRPPGYLSPTPPAGGRHALDLQV